MSGLQRLQPLVIFHTVLNMSFGLALIRLSSPRTCPPKKYMFFGQVKMKMDELMKKNP